MDVHRAEMSGAFTTKHDQVIEIVALAELERSRASGIKIVYHHKFLGILACMKNTETRCI